METYKKDSVVFQVWGIRGGDDKEQYPSVLIEECSNYSEAFNCFKTTMVSGITCAINFYSKNTETYKKDSIVFQVWGIRGEDGKEQYPSVLIEECTNYSEAFNCFKTTMVSGIPCAIHFHYKNRVSINVDYYNPLFQNPLKGVEATT